MRTVEGKYNSIKIMTDNIEQTALDRVQNMANLDYLKDTNIVMMPDVHEGVGCAIGTSMVMNKKDAKISPTFIGVDIGCGMSMYPLGKLESIDFKELDEYIKRTILTYPRSEKETMEMLYSISDFTKLLIGSTLKKSHNENSMGEVGHDKLTNSIGTLGGGNHFLEIGKNSEDEYFITVHSGSRFFGAKIAEYYQQKAIKLHNKIDTKPIVNELKRQRKYQAIEPTMQLLKQFDKLTDYKDEECYLWGEELENYIHDSKNAQSYAFANRMIMIDLVLKYFEIEFDHKNLIDSPHNYIQEYDNNSLIVRKGACNAAKGQDVLIPINMRDGIIYGKGKGNNEWNQSAPHGAGRILSRRKAKEKLDLDTFKDQMKDVYSSTVVEETLDESPDAYKPIQEILDNIQDTVEVIDIIKPVYSHKGIEHKKWWMK